MAPSKVADGRKADGAGGADGAAAEAPPFGAAGVAQEETVGVAYPPPMLPMVC